MSKPGLIEIFSRQNLPVSAGELLRFGGEAWSPRTLRRWLAELVQEGVVTKLGQGRATRYVLTKRPELAGSAFSRQSLTLLEATKRPMYERPPVPYNRDWFDSYHPNETAYLPAPLRAQLHQAGGRSTDHDPAGTYARHIFNRLLIDLSFNSSRLEGNTYSLLDTERLLLKGESADGKLDLERVMILNHKEAIRYLVDGAEELQPNYEQIRTIHYLLSDSLVDDKHVGQIRDHGVRVGGSSYLPYEDPAILDSQLHRVCEKACQINDPFEQSLFLLIHLSYLQAFADVNKRTARLAANIPLVRGNFVPISFNDVERSDYTAAIIAIYEFQEVKPIVDLFSFSYFRGCALYDATVRSLGFDEVRVRYRQQRRAVVRAVLLGLLHGKEMEALVQKEAESLIPAQARDLFIEDVHEDLRHINTSRLAGLGVTAEELEKWHKT